MRILVLRANIAIPDSRLEKECAALAKAGHDVTVVEWNRVEKNVLTEKTYSFVNNTLSRIISISIPARYALGFKKLLLPMIRYQASLIKWLFKHYHEYDAIHACDLDTAILSIIVAKLKKKLFIYDVFDYYCDNHSLPSIVDKVARKIDTAILNSSDCVILCSEMRIQQIAPAKPKAISIIHNSPPISFLENDKSNSELLGTSGLVRIVYMGSLVKDRFIIEIIDVIGKRTDCELHIGGYGPIQDQIEEMSSMYPNVYWYGKLKYSEVLKIEKNCDIMTALYSPDVENHKYAAPNKFYESLMLKKPVIMMNDTGMDKFVSEYDLGYVINGGKETFKEGFSSALDNLILRKNEWADMGKRGYKLYNDMFSWDEMEKRLLNLYDKFQNKI